MITTLGPEDLADVLRLQGRVVRTFGASGIWEHDEAELTRLFGLGDDFLALGVRVGADLVGVSLSRAMRPDEVRPTLRSLPWNGQAAHIGLNTLSLPTRHTGPLMIRLLRARHDHLRARGVHHLFGGVGPDNPVSLGCALRAGAIGVGHLSVPGGHEILLWSGHRPPSRAPAADEAILPITDLDGQDRLMRDGFAIRALVRSDRERVVLSPFRGLGS